MNYKCRLTEISFSIKIISLLIEIYVFAIQQNFEYFLKLRKLGHKKYYFVSFPNMNLFFAQ